ncbi:MAG: Uma2 family endonuclease [Chloroflexaceae bacterium]|nr:Uma2 family endonuclease [Chloroflexaceae bacterium]
MSRAARTEAPLTVDDLAALPQEAGTRYELIDGELHVTSQPHEAHQFIATNITIELGIWNRQHNAGRLYGSPPGVVFGPGDAVAPDVVWVSAARVPSLVREGKLYGAPDLMVEILSAGSANTNRDRTRKLTQYDTYGVQEYWIVDRFAQTVEAYRRDEMGRLTLAQTYTRDDELTSPLLPDFACRVAAFFGL